MAEDNAPVRASLSAILATAGYVVLEAEDGFVALQMLNEHPIDILLLDLRMPRCDGLWLLRHIDQLAPIVIIYSAFEYDRPEQIREQIGSKVFRYLWKPVSPEQLLATIEAAGAELASTETATVTAQVSVARP